MVATVVDHKSLQHRESLRIHGDQIKKVQKYKYVETVIREIAMTIKILRTMDLQKKNKQGRSSHKCWRIGDIIKAVFYHSAVLNYILYTNVALEVTTYFILLT